MTVKQELGQVYLHKSMTEIAETNLNQDGSITPCEFKFQPAAGEVFNLVAVKFMLDDVGKNDKFGFASGIALTNGLLLEVTTRGNTAEIANFTTNSDLATILDMELSNSGGKGFLDSRVSCVGTLTFPTSTILYGNDEDNVKFTVRDDLSGVEIAQAFAMVSKDG